MNGFAPGERVRVRALWPEAAGQRVHIRTPAYVRGHQGVIERRLGEFRNPERLAFGKPGFPLKVLYQVRFAQAELWSGASGPGASGRDSVTADLFEHWLEPAGGDSHG